MLVGSGHLDAREDQIGVIDTHFRPYFRLCCTHSACRATRNAAWMMLARAPHTPLQEFRLLPGLRGELGVDGECEMLTLPFLDPSDLDLVLVLESLARRGCRTFPFPAQSFRRYEPYLYKSNKAWYGILLPRHMRYLRIFRSIFFVVSYH